MPVVFKFSTTYASYFPEVSIVSPQRRAACFVKKDYRHTTSVTGLLNKLGWLPLFEHRKHSRLMVFYKALNNLSAISLDHLSVSSWHTRASNHPMKTNLCHCQFVLMFSNIHFFLGPLLIGTPFPWRFVFCSWLSLSMGLGWTRHPPNCCWPSWHSGGNGWAAPIAGYFTEEPILTAYSARLTYYTLSSNLWKGRFSMQVSDSFCDCHRVLHLR